MNEETKEEIKIALAHLRQILIKNGVSMAMEFKSKEIAFFDTKAYLDKKEFVGFSVKTDDLVK